MSERLTPLLEWINVDREAEEWNEENVEGYRSSLPPREVQRRLFTFVKSFDGHPLKVRGVTWPDSHRTHLRLEELRYRLNGLLLGQPPALAVRSLAFRLEWGADGANTMIVGGTVPDLVLFLAARLMTEERIELDTCEAPEPRRRGRPKATDPKRLEACGNLFVVTGRGNPKRYCSSACKERAKQRKGRVQ